MSVTVKTSLSRQALRNKLRKLPKKFSGKINTGKVDKAFKAQLAVILFGHIETAFRIKAKHGTDKAGDKWKPLSPTTIANRPISRIEKVRKMGSVGIRTRGLLTPEQDARWKSLYSRILRRLMSRVGEAEAKARAARYAWTVVKAEGAFTKLGLFGDRYVEILRVTDRLLRSVSAGSIYGARYYKPAEQVYELSGTSLTLGSKVPYAGFQHKHRRLWPTVKKMVAMGWMKNAASKAAKYALDYALEDLK